MLARILPILALVVLCVLGYWLYSQGTLQQIIRPTVVAVETKRQLIEGQKIRKSFIEIKEIAITRVEPGMITFPEGTTVEDVERAMSAQTIARNVDKGRFLRSTMLGSSANFIVLRAKADIQEGESLSVQNMQATRLDSSPRGGSIIFDTEEEANLYINKAFDLTARKLIVAGQTLTIDDTSGGSSNIFVVRTSRDFGRSERLSISGLEAVEINSRDVPSGAIAFKTRGAADVFIASAGKFILSEGILRGDMVVADVLSAEQADSQSDGGDLPRTLAELTSYMKAYPDRAMFLERGTFIGTRPIQVGDVVDVWVEKSRSGGAFGQITLERVMSAVAVRKAEDTSVAASADNAIPAATDETVIGDGTVYVQEADVAEPSFHWIVTDPAAAKSFSSAKASGGVAFAMNAGELVTDLIGNGASCTQDLCVVSRNASADMKDVRTALRTSEEGPLDEQDQPDPLTVLDGVSLQLQDRLRANKYDTFEAIALWSDEEIPAITIKLDISSNLAFYIREQARILTSTARAAAQGLGFEEAPTE